MALRLRRWLGVGPPPAVGVQFRDDGAYLALVRPRPLTVVGLGRVTLTAGTVVDQLVRRPGDAAEAVEAALSMVHWTEQPMIHASVEPEQASGRRRSGLVGVPVSGRPASTGGRPGPDHSSRLGTVVVSRQVVFSVASTLQLVSGSVTTIEPTPVSVARFLRAARFDSPSRVRFATQSAYGRTWSMRDGGWSVDVEVFGRDHDHDYDYDHDHEPVALVDGADPSRLHRSGWGTLAVDRVVEARCPRPAPYAAAVGAALGHFVDELSANLLLPWPAVGAADESSANGPSDASGAWGVEGLG